MDAYPPSPQYHSWLLRCWREPAQTTGRPGHWRFNLEEPGTGLRRGFASLPALIAWLEDQLAEDEMA